MDKNSLFVLMDEWINYTFDGNDSQFQIEGNKAYFPYPCENTSECSSISISLKKGLYTFELWGAEGGRGRELNNETLRANSSGKGAYVSGNLYLKESSYFYLYIGGKGEDQTSKTSEVASLGGFNGGGKGGVDLLDQDGLPESAGGGGGSTDIRLVNNQSIFALKSRIMVAAGGGGGVSTVTPLGEGMPGGKVEGFSNGENVFNGTQTKGHFGFGQDGYSFDEEFGTAHGGSIGGCGSGYYGGYLAARDDFLQYKLELGGSSGSSFASGCNGCNAVMYTNSDEIIHSNQSVHYSGYKFNHINMKSGYEEMPIPFDSKTEIGHEGSGAIVITYLGDIVIQTSLYHIKFPLKFFSIVLAHSYIK